MVCSRPDLAYAISVVSRFMANPRTYHWEALKWILRYLINTTGLGLKFEKQQDEIDPVVGYVDSYFAGNLDTRKSLTGYVFIFYGTTITWKSNLQSVVALSTTEAEFIVVTRAIKEELWKKEEETLLLNGYVGLKRPKTKIVCTLGPASRSVDTIEKLLRAGMSVARFNFSHGSHEYHQETLNNLNAASRNTGVLCAVMLDTKGPEIRTGFLKEGKPIQLKQGQEITISTDYTLEGDENMISMSYKKLAVDLKPQSLILCSDGTISLTVLECDEELGLVRCRCENTAVLGERKNVNLPGVAVDLPTLTEKDKEDILQWGIPNKIDIIALSFVRKGSDLVEARKLLGEHAKDIVLMSKVENQEGVSNFDEILANSDAFMVARGDLGMEIPIEKIFLAQKNMIQKCNMLGKPVVTATQMLESMIKSPRPTRAEATDVANAVIDGSDCVMLSGETADGAYPVLAVETMAKICMEAERYINYDQLFCDILKTAPKPMSSWESMACAAVQIANSCGAASIIALCRGRTTPKFVAKYRPSVPILSVTRTEMNDEFPAKQGLIFRGVVPVIVSMVCQESDEKMLEFAMKQARVRQMCKLGDSVVVLQHNGKRSSVEIMTVS
ncbi:pyruvate kinase, cytosolic isozyme-like [Henckelia pumila]|uniref:pyruvate kinase, cytosolic isozyme-like n=1 Tax=Henckelia pumila TaxID=405737 RepID=UPI003C6DDBFF